MIKESLQTKRTQLWDKGIGFHFQPMTKAVLETIRRVSRHSERFAVDVCCDGNPAAAFPTRLLPPCWQGTFTNDGRVLQWACGRYSTKDAGGQCSPTRGRTGDRRGRSAFDLAIDLGGDSAQVTVGHFQHVIKMLGDETFRYFGGIDE